MEGVSSIHWHDCRIISCVELPNKDQLIMNVEYPENWENNCFAEMAIIFNGFHALEVNEIPFFGEPTILSVESTAGGNGYFKVKLETNAGYRQVTAQAVSLVKEWQYA